MIWRRQERMRGIFGWSGLRRDLPRPRAGFDWEGSDGEAVGGTMTESWLNSFKPDADELLDRLLPMIDDSMLCEVAAADYGNDIDLHLAPLQRFRNERLLLNLEWHPREVLELIRWSQPDEANWKPGNVGRRGHLLRAFACAALLRSYAEPQNIGTWNSFNETAIQLADSLQALDDELVAAGVSFLAWCIEHLAPLDEEGMEGPFLGLALLSLTAKRSVVTDEAVIRLCKWIDASVSSLLRDKQWRATRGTNWLLSTNYHDLKNGRWIELGRDLYTWADASPASDRMTRISYMGRSLSED
jgi:hypothetical protein